jgi:hypothetical protein
MRQAGQAKATSPAQPPIQSDRFSRGRKIMTIASRALAALLLAGIAWSVPAQAQGVLGGTYLQSCGNVGMAGDTLFASCRTRDGRERRAELPGVSRCVGDIGNNNGRLQCSYGEPQAPPQPGYGAPPYGQMPQPGYGPPR